MASKAVRTFLTILNVFFKLNKTRMRLTAAARQVPKPSKSTDHNPQQAEAEKGDLAIELQCAAT